MTFSNMKSLLIMSVISVFASSPLHSEPLSQAIKVEAATNEAAIRSQKKIDALSEKTRQMLEQYRSAIHQTKSLQTYNKHLKDLLNSQQQEKESLQQQLQDIETTQRDIVPLLLRMLDSLDKFIQLDVPFLAEERQQRLANLKAMVVRADVTNAEKFRRILEAYQIENDYGKTIEAYRGDLELNGVKSSVDFLRLGRIALYYQRLDGSETGYWNKETKQWQVLPSDYRNAIRNGLRIARKEAAPDLLTLPIPAVEAGQ
ncbi:DUF3450 domain-containing protein [Methylomarinum vadi]|uniref:DUF3450 domain-containing protein n=1 Tax=Methylomarinum vadi TaxID=438855 RepID=UPI00068D36ED|nr:DUF3450 domain-containing protein [Methylomarinum vadi]